MMDTNLQIYAENDCLINKTQTIVVGVSGGADSQALLHWLNHNGYIVVAAYFDHQLRDNSRMDAGIVENLARDLRIPFVLGTGNVLEYKIQQKMSIEEAARFLRYQFLFETAKKYAAQAVAVGHTANDQVETVLMHLIRGAGLKGLQGMAPRVLLPLWDREIPLVRPFLNNWRDEVSRYCEINNLHPVDDETNRDLGIFRNRIRQQLIPFLEDLNPGIMQAVVRMADNIQDDLDILESLDVQNRENALFDHKDMTYTGFYKERLMLYPAPQLKRLLMQEMRRLVGWHGQIDYQSVQQALRSFGALGSSKISLGGGAILLHEGEIVWLYFDEASLPVNHWPQMVNDIPIKINIPGVYNLANDWKLVINEIPATQEVLEAVYSNPDNYTAWMDVENFEGSELAIKGIGKGERFAPLGMTTGSLRLSEYMINVKLPKRARRKWPILYCGNFVAWVPGFQISNDVRVSAHTRRVARLELHKASEKS